MKGPTLHTTAGRRALLCGLSALCSPLRPAFAGDEPGPNARVAAQSLGLTQGSLLPDPRSLGDERGLVWGGRDRCDPTASSCTQDGQLSGGLAVQPVPTLPAGVTVSDRFAFDLTVGGQPAGRLAVGLFGSVAPETVAAFAALCRGTLITSPGDEPAALERSGAVRVVRDSAVVLGAITQLGGSLRLVSGQTRPQRFPVQFPQTADTNELTHGAAGLLSMRRGGGSFEFTLTPRASPQLDKDGLVIGQLLTEESMAVLARINDLAVDNYRRAPLAPVKIARVTQL